MNVLFLDCFSGISGDMAVGALCDLGVKPSTLEWELSKLELGAYHMHFERAERLNVEGTKFNIHEGATHAHPKDEEGEEAHAHGPECQHGHGEEEHLHSHPHTHHHPEEESREANHGLEEHGHTHHHDAEEDEHESSEGAADHDHGREVEHEHLHSHADEDEHGHHEHTHPHVHGRNHREIRKLIEESDLSAFVKKHALGIFQRIAVAEGRIHGVPAEEVAFHEVGALDSIADIVCVCIGIEALAVEKIFVSSLHDGHGWVDCAHGRFPLPAPATLEILKGISIGQIDEPHELITPTGAAIVAEFGASFGLMPQIKVEKIGYGIGSRKLKSRPNVLRMVLGELTAE